MKGDKLLIVDFHALLHRSRNALAKATGGLTTSDGRPTTGTYGFTNNLLSIIDIERPSHVVVCYDAGGNWRKEASSDYKANRVRPIGEEAERFNFEAKLVLDEVVAGRDGTQGADHRGRGGHPAMRRRQPRSDWWSGDRCHRAAAHQPACAGADGVFPR